MQRPYVSICIFTYNRCQNLSTCLESIFLQPEINTGKIEVIVSDNASSDDTIKICSNYEKQYACFKYYRHDTTVPAGDNLVYAVSYGTGKLLKLCKDTMFFFPGSLAFLCSFVEKYSKTKPNIWFSNGDLFGGEKIIGEGHDPSEFVKLASYYITDVAHVAIWRKDWLGLEQELRANSGRDSGHIGKICECLKNNPEWVIANNKIYRLVYPLIKNVSYGIFHFFYEEFISFLNNYQEQGIISVEAVDKVKTDLLFKFFPFWIIACKLHYPQYVFSKTEDLRSEVLNAYKNERYFDEFFKRFSLLEDSLPTEYTRLYNFCSSVEKIYLYGTGEGSYVVKEFLDKKCCKVDGYIVSPGHKLCDRFCDIPVYDLDSFECDGSVGIVVAVGSKLQKDILQGLNKRGYQDHVFVQKIFDLWSLE